MNKIYRSIIYAVPACVGVALVAGCMAIAETSYTVSAKKVSGVTSFSHSGTLFLKFPGDIEMWINPPAKDALVTALNLVVQIPAGHVVQFLDRKPTVATDDSGDLLTAELIGIGGYRFKGPESPEKVNEALDFQIGRDLIGSTWNTHHFGQHEYSQYSFLVKIDNHLQRFRVTLPPFSVDGRLTDLPTIVVEYRKWHRWPTEIGP